MKQIGISPIKAFLLGLAVSGLILFSFFAGAVADRVFILKPVDVFLGSRKILPFSDSPAADAKPTILNSDERSVVDVAERASQSVVTVSIKKQQRVIDPFEDSFFGFGFGSPDNQGKTEQIQRDIGTGFIVDKTGLIVTNKHVVSDSNAEYLVIDQQDKEYKVARIFRDPSNDLAILRVEGLNAQALELGDSNSLKVGQSVIAIGTALGEFRHTVTTGVVSGLGRGIEAGDPFGLSIESLEGVIQTDAAINPGNSGGPLLDSNGRVIGVNVAVSASGQNIGFAIPINVIKTSLQNFNSTGQFDRPSLGIRYRMISLEAALRAEVPQGAYVLEVVSGSTADQAGIKEGDIMTEFEGKSLKDNDLAKLINTKRIGDKVKLKFWTKGDGSGQEKEIEITLRG